MHFKSSWDIVFWLWKLYIYTLKYFKISFLFIAYKSLQRFPVSSFPLVRNVTWIEHKKYYLQEHKIFHCRLPCFYAERKAFIFQQIRPRCDNEESAIVLKSSERDNQPKENG